MDTLEDKLTIMDSEVRNRLIKGLLQDSISPERLPCNFFTYHKFPDKIAHYFKFNELKLDEGETPYDDFAFQIGKRISHKPLINTFLGMYASKKGSIVPREMPLEVLDAFCSQKEWGKWSMLYLFNGIWQNARTVPIDLSEDVDVYGITLQLVKKGMAGVMFSHNHSVQKGSYACESDVPYGEQIYLNMPGLEDVRDPSFSPEEGMDDPYKI